MEGFRYQVVDIEGSHFVAVPSAEGTCAGCYFWQTMLDGYVQRCEHPLQKNWGEVSLQCCVGEWRPEGSKFDVIFVPLSKWTSREIARVPLPRSRSVGSSGKAAPSEAAFDEAGVENGAGFGLCGTVATAGALLLALAGFVAAVVFAVAERGF